MYRAGIVTLSDKGAAGEREDKSGAVIREILEAAGYEGAAQSLLPDEGEALKKELIRLSVIWYSQRAEPVFPGVM